MSYVSVVTPNIIDARYVFPLSKYSINLVADPTQTGNTPFAIGSSVPACPICLILRIFLRRATTSKEVNPSGLFIFKMPNKLNFSTGNFINQLGNFASAL